MSMWDFFGKEEYSQCPNENTEIADRHNDPLHEEHVPEFACEWPQMSVIKISSLRKGGTRATYEQASEREESEASVSEVRFICTLLAFAYLDTPKKEDREQSF